MQITLEGRRALITGGSKGLGLAMAKRFTESGAKVAIVARGRPALEEAASATGATPIEANVGTADGCDRAYAEAERALGGIDILVNNAGTSARAPFLDVTDADWQADLDLKLFAAIRLSRLVWRGMQARKWGRIINVLNTGAKAPPAGGAPTAVSRAAGLALTKVLAGEGAPHGILVNALLVGIIESDQWVRRFATDNRGLTWEQWKAEQGRGVPLGRIGKAEEFADTACFLASDNAGYIAGVAINVDGGRSPVV